MTTTEAPAELIEVEFAITGMTCGSCAARVEKALVRQPGVATAGVNLASEKATVAFDPSVTSTGGLIEAVVRIGYGLPPVTADWLPAA